MRAHVTHVSGFLQYFVLAKLATSSIRVEGFYVCISRVHAPMIAVGSDDPNQSAGGKVHIYEYSDNTR